MTEKLEKLIALAVTDGVITDRELEILKKKAKGEGVDEDELEMLLDTRLYERNEALKEDVKNSIPPPPKEKPKTNKEGDIKKCPSCGAPAESFNTKCADCGHEFRNIKSSNSISELFQKMNEIQTKKSNEEQTFKGIFIDGLSGGDKTIARKRELLKSFPIPNTKEDILEFLALAIPNCKKPSFWKRNASWESQERYEMAPIWQSKCEQIIMKARFSMKEDKSTLSEIEHYAKELKIK